ncbi:hypothetical protein EXIGLDRAFT_161943 [Exidia glandulosa HHB12029]|uniref:Uncharacterized protein n=1 Tax=Exidia glandulosa HHB12029 TaxID=1314781 RepID=A0A165FH10_EXIGL|nr:hypothetical protein EXIGLDRAFT_161943 [Exidia glandulosa HHB12029]
MPLPKSPEKTGASQLPVAHTGTHRDWNFIIVVHARILSGSHWWNKAGARGTAWRRGTEAAARLCQARPHRRRRSPSWCRNGLAGGPASFCGVRRCYPGPRRHYPCHYSPARGSLAVQPACEGDQGNHSRDDQLPPELAHDPRSWQHHPLRQQELCLHADEVNSRSRNPACCLGRAECGV